MHQWEAGRMGLFLFFPQLRRQLFVEVKGSKSEALNSSGKSEVQCKEHGKRK